MIPLVFVPSELQIMRELVVGVAEGLAEYGASVEYRVGTMIEIPRAALLANEVAKHADFFFGTNDLTQLTYGIPRRHEQVLPRISGKESCPTRRSP